VKTFAHHDVDGNIPAIVTVDAPDGVEVMLQTEPGVSVTELQAVDFGLDAENVDAVQQFLSQHRVAVRPARPETLVRRVNLRRVGYLNQSNAHAVRMDGRLR
jgi:hypothetical protein